jgi:hypothetical protein
MLDQREREPQGRPGRRTTDDVEAGERTMRKWLAPSPHVVKRSDGASTSRAAAPGRARRVILREDGAKPIWPILPKLRPRRSPPE